MNEISNRVLEGVGENEPDEVRYMLYATLPSLEEMAVNQVALAIWYSYLSRTKYNEFKKESNDCLQDALGIDEYWKECDKLIESLKTHRSFEEKLKTTMESVWDEIRSWIQHFKYNTFSRNLEKYRFKRFDANCFVWLPNCKIDYGKSGPKMLSTPGLNIIQKFAIMSEFCLEKEIGKFSLHSLPKSFFKQVNFDYNYLIYYWIRYLKKDFSNFPLNEFNSIDIAMASMCVNEHWTAFEYFWNRLGIDDQVTVAVFTCLNYSHHQSKILSKLTWPQQRKVLSKIPDKILMNFWINSPELSIWTWNHSKDLMTVEQFADVVKEMFYRKIPFEEGMRMFIQIWDTASDPQRDYIIQTLEDEIIRPFFFMSNPCPAAFEFLYTFLSMKNDDCRKRILLRNAGEFGSQFIDPNSMNDVVNLCLPNVLDQTSYKNSIMESHDMQIQGEMSFNNSELQNLKLKVQFYSTDESIAQRYVKRLVESKMVKKSSYVTDFAKWNEFSDFVDDIFSNDMLSGLNLKKEFITSYALNNYNDWNEGMDDMVKVVNSAFTNNDELLTIKQAFLNSFRKAIVDVDYWPWFEEKYFKKFVSWCIGGDDGVDDFKKTISVDAIFDEYFSTFEDWYSEDGGFDKSLLPDLDKCLKWYFMGVEGARNYKLAKVYALDGIGIFKIIFERNDVEYLDVLLKWFFDDDQEGIRKFKAKRLKVGKK